MVLMVDCHRRVDHNPSDFLFASQLSWDIEDIVTICKKMLETDTIAPLGCQTSFTRFSHDFPRIRSGFYRHFLKRDHCQHFFLMLEDDIECIIDFGREFFCWPN